MPGGAEGVARRNDALLSTRRTTSVFVGISLTCTALSWAWKATSKSDREQSTDKQSTFWRPAAAAARRQPVLRLSSCLPRVRDGEGKGTTSRWF